MAIQENKTSFANFDALRISLANAEDVRRWSKGEVKKPETINYRSQKPETDGLFCEKIFGPTKNWECKCGKYKRIRFRGVVCERCGVEVTHSKVRRERMGHIELAAPVSHIWFFKGTPCRIGNLLEISPKNLEKVLYFGSYIVTHVDENAREEDKDILKEELESDIDEIEAKRQQEIDDIKRSSINYVPAEDELVDDIGDDERLTSDQVEREIADINDEFDDILAKRQAAYELFMKIEKNMLIPDTELFQEMRRNYREYFKGGMGAEAIRELLEVLDLEALEVELKDIIENGKGMKVQKAIKRLKVVDALLKSSNKPTDMILTCIPVIPPDLRPMVQLDGGRFATSDLNDLYRRVINRNNRLKKILDLGAPEVICNNEKRMLQEAVDSLFDNGRHGRAVVASNKRPLKSLADMLKGKQGRFRQNLLGKRVDYSGRSVIVVGPTLKLHQCGLPSQMALELFKPFVIRRLVELEYAQTVKAAKRDVEAGASYVWDVLEEVISEHPVLLNRAPTLHRLGIQAFEPILVEDKAIQLHPLVCAAFNADFDGDQMAVHVPLGPEAQAEARILMLSSNNIKSPAHGRPLTVPSQDMIIGLYYLSAIREGFPGENRAFIDFSDAINCYESRAGLDLQAKIRVRCSRDTVLVEEEIDENGKSKFVKSNIKAGQRIETSVGRIIFNSCLPYDYPYLNYEMNKSRISSLVEDLSSSYDLSKVPDVLDALKNTGFHFATRAGVTVSLYDATVPDKKKDILAQADKAVAEVEEHYQLGELSERERHDQIVFIWSKANEDVGNAMEESFDKFNPVFMMAKSGARGNIKQIRQLAGMRGLMSDPKGEIIDRPIKANFREGLSVLEYFISTHGARKGLADTSLRTAESGYLTRRLVDVSQDVIVREIDCGSTVGIDYPIVTDSGALDENLIGRCLLEDAKVGKKVLLKAGEYIKNIDKIQEFADEGLDTIKVRTVVTCQAEHGVCQKCYGWDLATAHPVNIGNTVGIIAAQSIGEPGTQLTMRTFHTGGVAGDDITHGLPRVQELFEARVPKSAAVLAEFDGTMQLIDTKGERKIVIHNKDGELIEYDISQRAQLMPGVSDGCEVKQGQQLTKGSVAPKELLRLTDPYTTLRYIVREVQNVYISQGVDINDKHIEVIARQMLRRVVILEAGDTELVVGSQINRFEFEKIKKQCEEEGKNPPVAKPILLGIAKASLASDSFLSAASFQETTKILTDASLEGKVDYLEGLKENVITGHHIPAGTGLKRYRRSNITYGGKPIAEYEVDSNVLSKCAPKELIEAEKCMPSKEEWDRNTEGFIDVSKENMSYTEVLNESRRSRLSDEQFNLSLEKDLGVSVRWINKFSQYGINKVGDLIDRTEDDLIRMEGIGIKAIEELKEALESKDLGFVLENTLQASSEEMNTFVDVVFSPQGDDYLIDESDSDTLIEDDEIVEFSDDSESALEESMNQKTDEELIDELIENQNIEDATE